MTIAYVQKAFAKGQAVTSITTSGITTTSGNALIAGYTYYQVRTPTISDSKTNTWATAVSTNSGTGGSGGIAYALNITGGAAHTFTLSLSASDNPTISVSEFSGIATSGALDKTSTFRYVSGFYFSSGATATTTQADELLFGVAGNGNNGNDFSSLPAGWTVVDNSRVSGYSSLLSEYKIVSATGAYTFNGNANSSGNYCDAYIATFKGAAGGGTSLTATLGAATADGYSATVGQGAAIAAGLGAAVAGGYAATVAQGQTIPCTLGTAAADGYTATMSSGQAISGLLGTATASGYLASVSATSGIVATVGVATASGHAANVSNASIINCALAQAAADGFIAAISTGNGVACSTGEAVANGYGATIGQGTGIVCTLGAAAANGHTAAVSNQAQSLSQSDIAAIVAAIWAQAATTPIHADVRRVTGINIVGGGTESNPWGPAP